MNDAHADFLANPEANAPHLAECAECRAMMASLEARLATDPIGVDDLPLAGWESAGHRPWAFVGVCAAILVVIALALCGAADIYPIRAVTNDAGVTWRLFRVLTDEARRASRAWQIGVFVVFVIVNTVLFVLLRRAPRGIDA